MIKKLYDINCFDYKEFILQKQKDLSLSNVEAIILITALNINKVKNNITVNDILKTVNSTKTEVENALTSLLNKEFISIDIISNNGIGEEIMSFNGFFIKVLDLINNQRNDDLTELESTIRFLQDKFNRVLSGNEMDIISSLIENDKYTYENIKDAYNKACEKRKVVTIKALVQFLNFKDSTINKKETDNTMVKDFMDLIK